MLDSSKRHLPDVIEGTHSTTAAGNVSKIDKLMQWTRNPANSPNEPWLDKKKRNLSTFTSNLKMAKLLPNFYALLHKKLL